MNQHKMFRHSAIYLRPDSRVQQPQELRGLTVGIPEYQLTALVWVRGILEEEFGVAPSQVRWVAGGVESPGRTEKVQLKLPDGVRVEQAPPNRTLNELLLKGEIDALIAPRAPSAFAQPDSRIRRLFADHQRVEAEYFRRTGVLPIMHVLGIRRTLVEQHPWLPMSVTKAFTQAKDIAVRELAEVAALKVSLPWLTGHYEEAVQKMGSHDVWSYGVAANQATLRTFLRYHHAQGLSSRLVDIEELFAPSALEAYVI